MRARDAIYRNYLVFGGILCVIGAVLVAVGVI
jgi:hypothetical protein